MIILIIGGFLIVFGIIAMFSASIHESFYTTLGAIEKARKAGKVLPWGGEPSNNFYFKQHTRNILIAGIVAMLVYIFPVKLLKNKIFVLIVFGLTFLLQICVFIPGIGVDPSQYNGARGRIDIPGLPNIQPSEFFKLGYVIFFASRCMRKGHKVSDPSFYLSFIIVNCVLFFVFLLIPDFGTVLILGITGLVMVRYAGAKLKYLATIFVLGTISASVFVFALSSLTGKLGYIQDRISYFTDIFSPPDSEEELDAKKSDIGRQNEQALIAIGGGGFWGQGYGKGLQKFGYIPEAQSDFIFAAFSEEIGFVGNIVLLGLYGSLAFFFLFQIMNSKDHHLKLVGVGIVSLIIIQMFVNIGVNIRILPNTGLTLPFISHGGSALIVNTIELMLLYKILQETKKGSIIGINE